MRSYQAAGNNIFFQICVYISAASCTARTDFSESPSPIVSIGHRIQQVFSTTSCVCTDLLYISSSQASKISRLRGGIHRRTLLMCLPLLLQQWPAYLVRQIRIVLEIRDKGPSSCCFVGCCFQDVFTLASSILEIQDISDTSIIRSSTETPLNQALVFLLTLPASSKVLILKKSCSFRVHLMHYHYPLISWKTDDLKFITLRRH